MSIIVSVKIHEGVVMATDSATTFLQPDGGIGQIYANADKMVNLVKGLPIGVMTCGSANIGNAAIATLLKDLRALLSAENQTDPWKLNLHGYTMEEAAGLVQAFFMQCTQEAGAKGLLRLRVCGYSAGAALPEVWDISQMEGECPAARLIQGPERIGVLWEGDYEALDRLILGNPTRMKDAAIKLFELTEEQAMESRTRLICELYERLIMPAAPIQEAVDLARFLVETTIGFIRFSVTRPKTVSGPIEIAAIPKHEGFNWIQRNNFFPAIPNGFVPQA